MVPEYKGIALLDVELSSFHFIVDYLPPVHIFLEILNMLTKSLAASYYVDTKFVI